jgi:hypothetical protein
MKKGGRNSKIQSTCNMNLAVVLGKLNPDHAWIYKLLHKNFMLIE